MAANLGKFTDRSPIICAAGKPSSVRNVTVAQTLNEFPLHDQIEALKHDAKIWKDKEFEPPRKNPPIQMAAHQGIYTQIRPVLQPPTKTRYQTLVNDLKETTYSSYWNKPLGRGRDEVPGLPRGMKPLDVTFGMPTKRKTSVAELVNPRKTVYQVLWDSQIGHEMYKKTHNDYNPSEQVNRSYDSPPYNPDCGYRTRSKYDKSGIWVRCACEWHQKEPTVFASKLQADYLEKWKHKLGKSLTPNHNINCVPKNHRFGIATSNPFYGVAELLKDPNCEPCLFKRDFLVWLATLNKLRNTIKTTKTHKNINLDELYRRMLYYDSEQTGWISLDRCYEILSCSRLFFDKKHIESLLKILNIICGDKVNYKRFLEVINVDVPFELKPFNDIPKENQHYVTTQQASVCDYLIINNADSPSAGIPSIRNDLDVPAVPLGGCRAEISHYGNETSAKALLNPCIFTNYGLNFRDFYTPRTPEFIRGLFEKIGYSFPGNSFDKLWKLGLEQDRTGQVCVETFKQIVNKDLPKPVLRVDEVECGNSQ